MLPNNLEFSDLTIISLATFMPTAISPPIFSLVAFKSFIYSRIFENISNSYEKSAKLSYI